jgi:hypothetical protein
MKAERDIMRMTKARYDVFKQLCEDNSVVSTSGKTQAFWQRLVDEGWVEYLSSTCVVLHDKVKAYVFDGYLMLLRNLGKDDSGHNRS